MLERNGTSKNLHSDGNDVNVDIDNDVNLNVVVGVVARDVRILLKCK